MYRYAAYLSGYETPQPASMVYMGAALEWIFSMHDVTHSVSSLTSGAKIATVLLRIVMYITTEVKFV